VRQPVHGIAALDHVAGFAESPTFYPYLSCRENLQLFGARDGPAEPNRLDNVLEQVSWASRLWRQSLAACL